MRFLWPGAFWLLLSVVALVVLYVHLLRRRHIALTYSSLALIRPYVGTWDRLRRHIPPLVFLAAVIVAIIAIARPTARITLPFRHTTLILAMDVSSSMGADDVYPSRIAAAETAAKVFVEERRPGMRIGIVEFGTSASMVQAPTENATDLRNVIDQFALQGSTATGSAIYAALAALFPNARSVFESSDAGGRTADNESPRRLPEAVTSTSRLTPVPAGSDKFDAIVLMSDGRTTAGPDPVQAARVAAERGIRIFTVGFGTTEGAIIRAEERSMRVRLDEDALKTIAAITKGAYFHAVTASDLETIYRSLGARLGLEQSDTELTSLFAGVAAFLLLTAAGLSFAWFARIV